MATLLDYRVHQAVEHDGLPRVADYDDGSRQVLYVNGGTVVQSMPATAWIAQRGPLPSEPTQVEIDAALTAQAIAEQQARTDAAQLRQQILTTLQGALGVPFVNLSTIQLKAVVAALAWRAGALNKDTTLRPPADWIDR